MNTARQYIATLRCILLSLLSPVHTEYPCSRPVNIASVYRALVAYRGISLVPVYRTSLGTTHVKVLDDRYRQLIDVGHYLAVS